MTRAYLPLSTLLIVVALGASLLLYPRLPETIPTHWNIHGQVDAYGDKRVVAFLMPALMAALVLLFRLLPWLSPKRFEVDTFRATYLFLMFLTVALLGYIHALTLGCGATSGWESALPGRRRTRRSGSTRTASPPGSSSSPAWPASSLSWRAFCWPSLLPC